MFYLSRRPSRAQEDGGSAVEYGLLAAGIAGVVAATVFLFGSSVLGLFKQTCDSINTAASAASNPATCKSAP